MTPFEIYNQVYTFSDVPTTDLAALAGISSDLRELCNSLSQGVMDGITAVETRYWECRNFDKELSVL